MRVERSQPIPVERSQPMRVERSQPVRVQQSQPLRVQQPQPPRAERSQPLPVQRSQPLSDARPQPPAEERPPLLADDGTARRKLAPALVTAFTLALGPVLAGLALVLFPAVDDGRPPEKPLIQVVPRPAGADTTTPAPVAPLVDPAPAGR